MRCTRSRRCGTQAREKLDITTTIFSNRAYAILDHEMRNLGIGNYGESARSMLKLDKQHLDWTALTQGHGVDAVRVETGKALADALRSASRRKGPFLIEAVI